MAKVSGNTLVAKSIQQEGIDVLFGLEGGSAAEIMAAGLHLGIRAIAVRHEQAAVFAAAGWGYVKNAVGVCTLAAGPAVDNGVVGAHMAWDNCLPLVILGSSEVSTTRGAGAWQHTELSMFNAITKLAIQVDSTARLPELMAMAFRKARTGRPGPVYLDLPRDVTNATVDEEQVRWPTAYYTKSQPLGNVEEVKRAAELLLKAQRPLLIVGKGVRWSEPTKELRGLVESLGMPFLPSPMGRGFIPDDHPLNFAATRGYSMSNADVVLVVGARLNWMFDYGRRFRPDAKIIHVDIEPEEIGANRAVEVGIVGDAKMVLQQLLAEMEGKTKGIADRAAEGPWLSALRQEHQKNEASLEPFMNSNAVPIRTHRLLKEVRDVFPRETIYTADGHVTMGTARQVLPSYQPASRLNAGTSGCIGVGIPFALGAKLARPNVPVVSVNGDMAFGYNGFEIDTAVRYKIPITVIVNNNGGVVGRIIESRLDLPKGYNEYIAGLSQETRYDIVAQGLGAHPEHVTRPEQIRPALERAFQANKQGKVACVHVVSEPLETDSFGPGARSRPLSEIIL